MDEFLRDIHTMIFKEWILMQDQANYKIRLDSHNANIIVIETNYSYSEVTFNTMNIIELSVRTVHAYSSSRTVKKQPDSTITARITTAIRVTVLFFTAFLLLRCLPEFPEAGASACRCRCRY